MESRISEFVLSLHRASRRMRHEALRPWVFDSLASIVQFDSAFWFRWAAFEDRSYMHAWYLYRQPETLICEYTSRELWRDDVMYFRALAAPPGRAVRVSFSDYTSDRMRDFLRRHDQEHVMTIAIMQEIPQIAGGFSLYRNDKRQAFTEQEAQVIELATPHILDAWRENWLRELAMTARSEVVSTTFSVAALMPDLMMSEAQDNFGALMRQEWTEWRGPWLPEALHAHLRSDGSIPWVGKNVTAFHRRHPDGSLVLLVRQKHALDLLSPRKRAVALLFAGGATQTEIAHETHLSASTVNNYLGDVYRQLEVTDKTDLSRLVGLLQP